MAGSSDPGSTRQGETSPAEWVLAGACAVLVVALIAFLLYDGLHAPITAPDPVVRVDSVTAGAEAFRAHVQVQNRGRTTAARLQLEGELRRDTVIVERASTTLDYVPAGGSREAGLVFSRDPRQFRLVVRATGYDLP